MVELQPTARVAVAYAGAIGENVGFYGMIITRQVAADRRAAGGNYDGRGILTTARELLFEFGPAELFDSLVVRPFAIGVGGDSHLRDAPGRPAIRNMRRSVAQLVSGEGIPADTRLLDSGGGRPNQS